MRNILLESKSKIDRIVRELEEVLQEKPSYIWCGSGLSKVARYRTWESFIKVLCDKCLGEGYYTKENLKEMLPEELMDLADKCKSKNHSKYRKTIVDEYGDIKEGTHKLYPFLVKMDKVKGFVTTNFDPLLYEAAKDEEKLKKDGDEYKNLFWYPNDLPTYSSFSYTLFYYIHGIAYKIEPNGAEDFVFSRTEFIDAYSKKVGCFLSSLFAFVSPSCPVIFLGCGLKEPQLHIILGIARDTRKAIVKDLLKAPTSEDEIIGYLLLCEKEDNDLPGEKFSELKERKYKIEKEYEEKGIKVLWYGKHIDLLEIFREVREKLKEPIKTGNVGDD